MTRCPMLALLLVLLAAALPVSAAEVLVEAEGFQDRGGWVVDQQFMDQMGSPYLLAHGLGVPVANASTEADIPQEGNYRPADPGIIASTEPAGLTDDPHAVVNFAGASPRTVHIDSNGEISFTVTSEAGWAVWWYFAVENLNPKQSLHLRNKNVSTPVVSEDRKTWRYFDSGKPYTVTSNKAWFAWYVPYILEDAQELDRSLMEGKRPVRVRELCRSEGGSPVPLLEIGEPSTQPKPVVWIQARQHAWEVGGSWTAHGLALWAASDDPRAKILRSRVDLIVVPIMDVDNVQRGNGGKFQKPHDHMCDWSDTPVWASVRAAQSELRPLISAKRLCLFIDMHDPGYGGSGVEWWLSSLKVLTPDARARALRLADIFKKGFTASYAFGGFKETGLGYAGKGATGLWLRNMTGNDLVYGALEIPVGPPKGFKQPPPSQHLLLGADIGRCLVQWLGSDDSATPERKAAAGKNAVSVPFARNSLDVK